MIYINKVVENEREFMMFNAKEFLRRQRDIYFKYISLSETSYIQNVNNYFLHIIEEIFEVEDAIRDNLDEEDILEEIADVLMYIGSSLYCFDRDNKYQCLLTDAETLKFKVTDKFEIEDINQVTKELMRLRRNFPERKWHKPYDEEDINHTSRSAQVMSTIQYLFYVILNIVNTHYDIDKFDFILNRKQNFILSLRRR